MFGVHRWSMRGWSNAGQGRWDWTRNAPYLNMVPIGGAVWKAYNFGDGTLLEEVCLLGCRLWDFLIWPYFLFFLSLLLLWWCHVISASWLPDQQLPHTPAATPPPTGPFSFKLPLVRVFCPSSRKGTDPGVSHSLHKGWDGTFSSKKQGTRMSSRWVEAEPLPDLDSWGCKHHRSYSEWLLCVGHHLRQVMNVSVHNNPIRWGLNITLSHGRWVRVE